MTDVPGGGAPSALPPPPPPGRGQHACRQGLFTVVRLVAVGSVVAGAGFLAYTGYRIWDPGARAVQQQMIAKLHTQRTGPAHPRCGNGSSSRRGARVRTRPGQPFAIMRIPKFGPHWEFAIVQGTSSAQLANGPGHVPGTALPGTAGNFAVAAHDITAGNPFLHLASLHRGDRVVVQLAGCSYRYKVTSEAVVRYTDTSVLAAVPGHPHARPTGQYLTLITCTPVTLDFTTRRIVVTGTLAQATRADASGG